jgi:hypothetical protein
MLRHTPTSSGRLFNRGIAEPDCRWWHVEVDEARENLGRFFAPAILFVAPRVRRLRPGERIRALGRMLRQSSRSWPRGSPPHEEPCLGILVRIMHL